MKQPIINLDEKIGKMVGKMPEGGFDYDKIVDMAESIMPRLPFPKGVYKFKTFEEADAWETEHILKAARKNNLDLKGDVLLENLLQLKRRKTLKKASKFASLLGKLGFARAK